MHVAVYVPLLVPLLAALGAGPLSRRLPPRVGTWMLTGAAVVLAGASTLALALLAATVLVRVPLLAVLGHYSLEVVHRDDPASTWVAVGAGVALIAASAAAARLVWRRVRAVLAAYREACCLPDGGEEVVVLVDEAAEAFAVPGRPGRVVVSTALLAALDPAEQRVLVAHERAHLAGRHYLFLAAAHLAAAANPLLRPVADAVGYTVERWADEHAATQVADRELTARTIARAALATDRAPHRRGGLARELALGVGGAAGGRAASLAGAGPVPRRVGALLAASPPRRRALVVLAVATVAVSALAALEGQQDLESLLELARHATGR